MSGIEELSLDAAAFNAYAFWVSILAIKMLLMSPLTAMQRMKKKAFANPEDLPSQKLKVNLSDPDVERVRRAHQNDLENILVFIFVGFLYLLTGPASSTAITLFRVIAISRIVHTLVYAVVVIPQPARAIAWGVPYLATFYMAVQSAKHFLL